MNSNNVVRRNSSFKGGEKEIEGYIFDFSDMKQIDTFSEMLKELITHVGKISKQPGDILWSLENLERFKVPKPEIEVLYPKRPKPFEQQVFNK